MSQKIKITPVMDLEAEVTVMNDRNASVALVHLWNPETGEVIGHATGASKREQGDIYNESVAVKLATGRALQKMARDMISEANREVRAAMAEAAEKKAEEIKAADDELTDFLDYLHRVIDDEAPYHGATPTTADGTPVTEIPEGLRRLLASMGLAPSEVQIVDAGELF